MIDYLYAELNENVPNLDYEGELTSTAVVNVDADKRTIGVDVLKIPHTLYINDIAFDGSEDVNININVPEESDVKVLSVNTGDILSDEDYELALQGKLILKYSTGGAQFQNYFMYDMRDGYIWFRTSNTPVSFHLVAYNGWDIAYNYLQIRQSDKTITANISGSSYTFVREYNFDSVPTENSSKLVNSGNLYTTLLTKQDKLPAVVNGSYLHVNNDTGTLEWSTIDTYTEILIPAGPISGTLTAEQLAKLNTPRCIFIYYGSLNSIPFIKSGDDGEYWYFYREPGIDVNVYNVNKTLEKSYSRIRIMKSNGAWQYESGSYKLLTRLASAPAGADLSLVYPRDMYYWDNKQDKIYDYTTSTYQDWTTVSESFKGKETRKLIYHTNNDTYYLSYSYADNVVANVLNFNDSLDNAHNSCAIQKYTLPGDTATYYHKGLSFITKFGDEPISGSYKHYSSTINLIPGSYGNSTMDITLNGGQILFENHENNYIFPTFTFFKYAVDDQGINHEVTANIAIKRFYYQTTIPYDVDLYSAGYASCAASLESGLDIFGLENKEFIRNSKSSNYINIDKNGLLTSLEYANNKLHKEEKQLLSSIVNIAYADLKSLKDNNSLIPGMKYRITDYTCTTTTTNTSSAGHAFDIIVTALSNDTLSEEAQAILHSGDTYFANAKLPAWKLWYSLENDTTRFAWADAINGKGVIYRMIDEFGNDCPYDFKNIKFTFKKQIVIDFEAAQYIYERNDSLDANGYYGWTTNATTSYGADTNYWTNTEEPSENSVIYRDTEGTVLNKPIVFVSLEDGTTYTFEQLTDNIYEDASLQGLNVLNLRYNCFGNVIKPYCYNGKLTLNFITFNSSQNNTNLGAYFNKFGNDCYYMAFDHQCYNNTFNNSCHHNIFNLACSDNKFDNNCYFNKAGGFYSYNSLGNDCRFNIFGWNCSYNTLNKKCYKNQIAGGSSYNIFDTNNHNNIFKGTCSYNNLGKDCYSNEFGNNCTYINLESDCSYIKTFDGANVVNYVRHITVDSGCNNINICSADITEGLSNYLQNVHICYGVANQTISVPDRNLDYEITYKMSGSTEVLL